MAGVLRVHIGCLSTTIYFAEITSQFCPKVTQQHCASLQVSFVPR